MLMETHMPLLLLIRLHMCKQESNKPKRIMSLALRRTPILLQILKQRGCLPRSGACSLLVFSRHLSSTRAALSLHPTAAGPHAALVHPMRLASTQAGKEEKSERSSARAEATNGADAKEPSAEELGEEAYAQHVCEACDYEDENLLVRLGFSPYEFVDESKVKRHFLILAKRYHPDLPDAPPNASEAFQRIREAHDMAIQHIRTRGPFREGEPHYFYADDVRRRIMVKALGAGVFFFLFATTFFIVVICHHNWSRLDATMLLNFFLIFFTLEAFPRLLAAALLFGWQSSHYVKAKELGEQANVAVVAEKGLLDITFNVQGISPTYAGGAIVQVTVMKRQPSDAASDKTAADAALTTTLTYGKGVLKVSLPLEQNGAQYAIKVVHDATQLVLFDQLLVI
ncbi:heat shock protein [Strigomonas culicis]|uniref:Heat shock protein n=1 Tax=Strigomonas culicis TaxID=28005 RepID=S9VVN1_9TRYP|nr:heat shock protein [Strigomonas culicis]|eukprot:EPY27440.1 heat shock protein [Strigomonas culicis]